MSSQTSTAPARETLRALIEALTSASVREVKPADLQPGDVTLGHGRTLPCRIVEEVRPLPFMGAEVRYTSGKRSTVHGTAYVVDVSEEVRPVATFRAIVDGSGVLDMPEVFGADVRSMLAALDWARAHGQAGNDRAAGDELRSIVLKARGIARLAELYAQSADHRASREDVPPSFSMRAEDAATRLLRIAQELCMTQSTEGNDRRADELREVVGELALVAGISRPSDPVMPASGTVRVLRMRGTIEDDGSGGSDWVYQEVDTDGHPVPSDDEATIVEDTGEAARLIIDAGCTETGSAPDFYDPDRSHTVDYSTGLLEETSAHLAGFTPTQLDDICRRVREGQR